MNSKVLFPAPVVNEPVIVREDGDTRIAIIWDNSNRAGVGVFRHIKQTDPYGNEFWAESFDNRNMINDPVIAELLVELADLKAKAAHSETVVLNEQQS